MLSSEISLFTVIAELMLFTHVRILSYLQLEQMELEVREQPSKDRNKHQTRLRSYQAELTKLEKDLVSTK